MFQTAQWMFQHARVRWRWCRPPVRNRPRPRRRSGYSRACSSTACAFTAERASRNATSIRIHQPQLGEPEIAHGARSGSDIERIARGDQDHFERAHGVFGSSTSRRTASSTPLMNATDSSPENWRASSSASSITTAGGRFQVVHFVNRQPQNVAIDGRHALEAPVRGFRGDALVDRAAIRRRRRAPASSMNSSGRRALRILFLGAQRFVERRDRVADVLLALIPQKQNLQSALAGAMAGRHLFATLIANAPFRSQSWRRRSLCCRPCRPRALRPAPQLSVVRTPKVTGTPRFERRPAASRARLLRRRNRSAECRRESPRPAR